MLRTLKRHFNRTPTAREMQQRSQEAKRNSYRAFHDNMAANVGRKIEWAE